MTFNNQMELLFSQELVDYQDAQLFMERRCNLINQNKAPEAIWLLEHEQIYTAGSSAKEKDLLVETDEKNSIKVFKTSRGGQYTYHNPGQRIVYPMINIKERKIPLPNYMVMLNKVVSETLAKFGITTCDNIKHIGVWVKENDNISKICAMGVRLLYGSITSHGIALNINNDLSGYKGIVPCGISEHGITSMSKMKNEHIDMVDVDIELIRSFKRIFGF